MLNHSTGRGPEDQHRAAEKADRGAVSAGEREACSPCSPLGLAAQAEEPGTLGTLCLKLAQGLKFKREGKHEPLTHITVSTAVSQHC